ncbi:hypothetical protein ISF62_18215 [Burkholderia pseudomallei]|uniref:hypothetical protein n=1 Tax=Burkholderia pseudomallei TaxID=28450 RepID=UPI000F047A57|nr:hypothetical protein [Burkholderia pseudomallei]MBF3577454.1 hypothetical protein [Burkholderia pseudomallei]CAJ8906377.1 Uncharacterised protein [Burkholderia pseudomallei]VBJ26763.1 Uncharacterised protein [Burkholderia pseudomallei]
MSKILSKADIFGSSDLTTETVDVPEWGGAVIIRTMTGTQRDAYEASLMKRGPTGAYEVDTVNMRAKLIAYTAVDDAGALLFDSAADVAELAGKNAAALERLFVVAQRLNGLAATSTADAEKNSGSGQDGGSTSASPQPSA